MLWSCNQQQPKVVVDTSSVKSSLDSSLITDSTKFVFVFDMKNMNSKSSLDSIWNAASEIQGMCGMELSLDKNSCRFYMDSFESYKDILRTFRETGYETEDVFGMTGPGLTCDIPSNSKSETPTEINEVEIIDVTSIEQVKNTFNDNSDKIRILTIPNPACLACVKGQRFVAGLFNESYVHLTGLFNMTIWTSINGWGQKEDAERLAPELVDDRVRHFWDEKMLVGGQFKKPLKLKDEYLTAWDVYLVYAPGAKWVESVPEPSFWMHQLTEKESGAVHNQRLDTNQFKEKLQVLIEDLPI